MRGSPNLSVVTDHQACEFSGHQEVTIGRDSNCSIVVDGPTVSRIHARLRVVDDVWLLEDNGSTGGIWHEGAKVTRLTIDEPRIVQLAGLNGPTIQLRPLAAPPQGPPPTRPAPEAKATMVAASSSRLVIGRDPTCDIVVDDLLVSRQHAVFQGAPGTYSITDLGSRNGTFVNGRRIDEADIVPGDIVTIGSRPLHIVNGTLVDLHIDTTVVFGVSGMVVEVGDRVRLVDEVSFDLPERSLLAIVGPSGAGKSSLLGVLSGLREPSYGQVLYQGRDLHQNAEDLVKRIGFVPQADLLHPGLTVTQSLRFTEQLRLAPDVSEEERDQRITDVLRQLGLSHRAHSRIDRLSGGERKRVNVATELLTDPSLLLLDEPASGLDAGLERTLMRLLRQLADRGRTIIVVTHSLDSLGVCDSVLVLAPGGVPAYMGPPGALSDRFGHDDLVETFSDLATDKRDWRDPAMARAALREAPGAAAPTDDRPREPRRSIKEWFAQLGALSRRFVTVLASDRRNLGLLLLQAPILGILMLVALPAGELAFPSPTQVRFVSTASLVLFVILLGASWLGANNSIREIARERDLFVRERAAGLSVSAYVFSKAVVLGVLTAVQSAVLVAIAAAAQGGPEDAVMLGWPLGELMLVVALAGVASMALSLFVSAVVGSPDRATTLLPIVLILQFVLSAGGVLPEIVDKPVLREMSALSSAQWGFAGAASTADLNGLQAFTDQLRNLREIDAADPGPAIDALAQPAVPDARWAHTSSALLTALVALGVLTVVPIVGAIVVLRRQEAIS